MPKEHAPLVERIVKGEGRPHELLRWRVMEREDGRREWGRVFEDGKRGREVGRMVEGRGVSVGEFRGFVEGRKLGGMEEDEAMEAVRKGLVEKDGREPRAEEEVEEVAVDGWLETWLKGGGMGEYIGKFKEQDIEGPGDLKGVGVTNVGRIFGVEKYAHIVRIGKMIEGLEVEIGVGGVGGGCEGCEEKKQ
ncbi:hypothetical protein TrRE_jg7210 [Triparma retinervis]|uniref:SAM domain-containing protein n=1 Tax=Triparma retinervis TaxID=2557542 RepID=A0A9W7AXF6_9STRA|nr:hypothetical protein TrRE_jg7210 [Triparma retinervis]